MLLLYLSKDRRRPWLPQNDCQYTDQGGYAKGRHGARHNDMAQWWAHDAQSGSQTRHSDIPQPRMFLGELNQIHGKLRYFTQKIISHGTVGK